MGLACMLEWVPHTCHEHANKSVRWHAIPHMLLSCQACDMNTVPCATRIVTWMVVIINAIIVTAWQPCLHNTSFPPLEKMVTKQFLLIPSPQKNHFTKMPWSKVRNRKIKALLRGADQQVKVLKDLMYWQLAPEKCQTITCSMNVLNVD